jgi:hypothetical protein
MSEHTTEEQQGCDVCGTVLSAPDGYLRLETDDMVFGPSLLMVVCDTVLWPEGSRAEEELAVTDRGTAEKE